MYLLLAFALWLMPTIAEASCHGASPTWTSTVERSSVASCVTQAQAGDTINVLAGNETWSTPITVNKGIRIIGAGPGLTVITRGGSSIFVISDPSNVSLTRISGFTFLVSSGFEGGGISLQCSDIPPNKYKIRIDNNLFTPSGSCTTGHCYIKNNGCRGVIDNNTFEGAPYPLGVGLAGDFPGGVAWQNLPQLEFGRPHDNIYVEDNVLNGISMAVTDCDEGGRYAFRYNNITGTQVYPFLDSHGGKGGVYSCMGVEIYANKFIGDGFVHANQYAARGIFHHNYTTGDGELHIRDGDGCPVLEHERMNSTYYFLNRTNGTSGGLMPLSFGNMISCGHTITPNVDFWVDNQSCIAPNTCSKIPIGVGAGKLDNRPAQCTPGTAYWATTKSTTSLTGMSGVNPTSPISGTLYRCTSPNTWTAFYTPFTYPHPLRAWSSMDDAPAAPTDLRVISR